MSRRHGRCLGPVAHAELGEHIADVVRRRLAADVETLQRSPGSTARRRAVEVPPAPVSSASPSARGPLRPATPSERSSAAAPVRVGEPPRARRRSTEGPLGEVDRLVRPSDRVHAGESEPRARHLVRGDRSSTTWTALGQLAGGLRAVAGCLRLPALRRRGRPLGVAGWTEPSTATLSWFAAAVAAPALPVACGRRRGDRGQRPACADGGRGGRPPFEHRAGAALRHRERAPARRSTVALGVAPRRRR